MNRGTREVFGTTKRAFSPRNVILSGAAGKGERIEKKRLSRGGVEVFVVEAQPSGENQGRLASRRDMVWN